MKLVLIMGCIISIIRYKTNGDIDSSFGVNGLAEICILDCVVNPVHMALMADGAILVTGSVNRYDAYGRDDLFVLRCNRDGSIDSSFGQAGIVFIDSKSNTDHSVGEVIFTTSEKVMIGGILSSGTRNYFGLVRLNLNGVIDSTFGTNGVFLTKVGGSLASSGILDVTLNTNRDTFVAIGYTYNYTNDPL